MSGCCGLCIVSRVSEYVVVLLIAVKVQIAQPDIKSIAI